METKKRFFGLFSILLLFLAVLPLAAADNVDVTLQWVVNGQGMGANKLLTIDTGETVNYQVAVNSENKYNLEIMLLDEDKEVIETLLNLPGLQPDAGSPDYEMSLDFTPENDDTTYYVYAIAYTTTGVSSDELQLNVNEEVILEVCDDADNDGVCDDVDLCPFDSDPGNFDKDDDGVGNVCDNCPNQFNPGQEDNYKTPAGDACEDSDGDGLNDDVDQCPLDGEDFDGFEDEDGCPEDNPCTDSDNDGVCNEVDNCPDMANPNQEDLDQDGEGNVCDSDIDGDGISNGPDECPYDPEDFDGFEDEDGCPEENGPVNIVPQITITGDNQLAEMETLTLGVSVEDEENLPMNVFVQKCLFTIPIPFAGEICFMPSYDNLPEEFDLSGTGEANEFTLTFNPDHTYVKHPQLSKTVTLAFFVDDGENNVKEEFKITVDDVNQLPILSSEGVESIDEGETFVATFTAEDADEEDVLALDLKLLADEFNEEALPEWMTLESVSDNTLQLTATPDCDNAGEYNLRFTADDSFDLVVLMEPFTVTEACEVPCPDHDNDGVCDVDDLCPTEAGVVENDGCPEEIEDENQAPTISEIDDQEVIESDLLEFDVFVSDVDGDKVTLEAGSRMPKSVQIIEKPSKIVNLNSATKEFTVSWQTVVGDAGDYVFVLVAEDRHGAKFTQKVNVAVLERPSCLDSDLDGICDNSDLCPLEAEDFDGVEDEDGCPEEDLCLDSDADGICDEVDLCPLEAEDFDGVEDEDGCPEEDPVVVVNHAPIILSTPITAATEDVEYTYQFEAMDPDGDVIAFTLAEYPEGMTMDDNGLIEWTPESGKTQAKVVILVTDGEFIVQQQYSIGIKEDYKNVKLASVQLAMEEVFVGDYLSAQVKIVNNGNKDMDDLKVSMIVPELGLKKSVSEFDLKPGQSKNKNLNLQVPYYVQPGQYLVKVSVSNSGFHEQTYRLITIY